MADTELPVEAGGISIRKQTPLENITGKIAVLGGLLALAVAILVTTSVMLRWLFNAPIDGDFEFVKMATAIAIFAYLPFTQARRSNIIVDTFTSGLTDVNRARLDAFWDIVYALAACFCTYALYVGTMEAMKSGETTMQRQLLVWPSIGLSALLCGLLALTAFLSAFTLIKSSEKG
jgi:TRAP-type C4-dicarboxylate transport system permease small subunit